MLDFLKIEIKENKSKITVYPNLIIGRSKDLMIRGKSFYAIWDEENEVWSREEFRAIELMDKEISKFDVSDILRDGMTVERLYFRDTL